MKKLGMAFLVLAIATTGAFASGATEDDGATADGVYTFTMFADFPGEYDEPTKALWQEIGEAVGVNIEMEVPPSTNYTERQQLMLASGDYPEMVLFQSQSAKVFLDAVRGGLVLELNDLVADAANVMEYTYDISWDAMKVLGDGSIYGMPRTSIARADGFIVRKDWLDNVGISVPEGGTVSIDEFTEILRAFTEEDPDGNGQNDTYGFSASTDGQGNMAPIVQWPFGLIGWQSYDDGEFPYIDLAYSRNHDNYQQALEYTNMLWENGWIDPDWPVTRRDISIERFKQGINGVIGEFAGWTAQYLNDMQPIQPDVELTYITGIEGPDGRAVGGSFSTGNWGLWSIMTGTERPEKIVDVWDYMLGDGWEAVKYGPEGLTWNWENGVRVPTDAYGEYAWGRRTLRRNDDPEFFTPLSAPADLAPKLNEWIGACIDQAVFSQDCGFRPAAADNPNYIDYQKEYQQAISKIIIGERPVSDYAEVLDGWYAAGGQAYVEQVNEFIATFQ